MILKKISFFLEAVFLPLVKGVPFLPPLLFIFEQFVAVRIISNFFRLPKVMLFCL